MRTGNRKWAIGCVLIAAAVVVVALISLLVFSWESRRSLDDELRLAREIGMPANLDDFRAELPSSQGNASVYLRALEWPLAIRSRDGIEPASVLTDRFRARRATRAEVSAYVARHKTDLTYAERATQLPSFRIDRRWSDGLAVLFPEYSAILNAGHLLSLRARLAFAQGRFEAGLADLDRIRKIGRLIEQERTGVAFRVGQRFDEIALLAAADAWFEQTGNPAVRGYLDSVLKESGPDFSVSIATDALLLDLTFSALDHPEFWDHLGLSMPELGNWDRSPLAEPLRQRARASEWRRARLQIEALKQPLGTAEAQSDSPSVAVQLAYPTFTQVIEALGPPGPEMSLRVMWVRRNTTFHAFLDAMRTRKDVEVVAPEWNQVRAKAKWKGKQLTITTTVPDFDPKVLVFSSDSPKP